MPTTSPPDLHAAVAELLSWQQAHLHDDAFPPHDEAALRADLEAFAEGRDWNAQERGWWEHGVKALVGNALAQPQIATRAGRMGPVLQDLALLLRGPEQAVDEGVELDLAIRWWEAGRKAGLPLGEDFGLLWQQFDWTSLLLNLTLLGQAGEQELLMAHAVRVATRYVALSPLARLLQDLQGGLVETAFTLR